MAETFGKCTNFASCTLAYRNQPVAYTGNPICPECGQPLSLKASGGGKSPLLLIVGVVVVLGLIGGGVFIALPKGSKTTQITPTPSRETPTPDKTPEPESTPTPGGGTGMASITPTPSTPTPEPSTPSPSTPMPTAGSNDNPPPSTPTPPIANATPAPSTPGATDLMPSPDTEVSVEKTVNTNLKGADNERVRAEVLKRIDLMPNLSAGDRDKLYARVDRAHGMGRVLIVPFAPGGKTVGDREINQLKTALKSPQVATLVKNPEVVFVLLGFADKRGDDKANQKISLDRAENISQTLKEKCGLQNVTQPVGMGGSALFDSGNFAKNRVVEVWAVVP